MHHTRDGAFAVDEYRRSDHGLYVRRRFEGHPRIRAWEAHIVPDAHLQVCRYHPHEGRWWCAYYVDVVNVDDRGSTVHVTDLYLDVAVTHDGQVRILDTDEFVAAFDSGDIDRADLSTALGATHDLVNDLSANGNDLGACFERRGIGLQWHEGGA